MNVKLNGQDRELGHGKNISNLLDELKLTPDKVAVELNRRLVRAAKYDTVLNEGDHIEIVTFVGGG